MIYTCLSIAISISYKVDHKQNMCLDLLWHNDDLLIVVIAWLENKLPSFVHVKTLFVQLFSSNCLLSLLLCQRLSIQENCKVLYYFWHPIINNPGSNLAQIILCTMIYNWWNVIFIASKLLWVFVYSFYYISCHVFWIISDSPFVGKDRYLANMHVKDAVQSDPFEGQFFVPTFVV